MISESLESEAATSWSHQAGSSHGISETRGSIFRRLVARTMAKQIFKRVEAASAPFQYALKTKAGCESVAHVLQTLTDFDPEATVMS